MELKAALKEAKKLLSENKNEQALNLLQEFLDDGVEDYMLLCFAALACGNLDNPSRARTLYEKAITRDGKMPIAWQGLYKLYDTGKLTPDDRAIEVCSHLINTSDSEEKRNAIEECRRRIFFEMSRYDQLLNDLGTNTTLLGRIIDRLGKKDMLSTTESTLLEKVFCEMKSCLGTNAEWNLYYCKLLYKKRNEEWSAEVTSFCSRHAFSEIPWVRDRLLEMTAREYFCRLEISDDIYELYSKCILPTNDVETKTSQLLNLLKNGDMSSSLDIVDGLSDASLMFLPLALVAVHLLAEVENWEKVLKVAEWLLSQNLPETCQAVVYAIKRRVFLEINRVDEALNIAVPQSLLPPSFATDSAKVALLKGERIDELIDAAGKSSVDAKRFRILRALRSGTAAEALDDAESLLNDDLVTWRDLVLVAELNIALSKDATALLVKAAKINPRSSRVFFVLGKALRRKNPAKAKSCLERAVKIRPTNEEYVKELDDVYEESGEADEQRLNILKQLGAYRKPMWLRKRLAVFAKAKQDWDSAISELQQIVRYQPDDILCWASLAEAYSNRGNLQSSVNAYGRVLEIDPSSDYAICLIQVLMRMHNLEGAAEHCAKWRSAGAHNPHLKTAVDILEAQVHLRLYNSALGTERLNHLKAVFGLLDGVISERPRISLAYKLAADALLHAIKFRDELFMSVGIPSSWSVSCRVSAVRSTIMFYSVALDLNRENAWAWNDLATALLVMARLEQPEQNAVKAHQCLRKAMSLCKCAQMRSQLWVLIAEAERLKTASKDAKDVTSIALQQHYLVRALQLNKASDEAWLRLALLYYTNGAMVEAHLTIETALKHNPSLAEAWCAWALKAESEGLGHEAMDMFRHSVSIKPVAAAVMKYTAFLCQSLRVHSFDPATVMIDFNNVLRLRDECGSAEKDLLLHIGVLAELFGHYEDAVRCIEDSGRNGVHLQRASMKAGRSVQNHVKSLEKLAELCKMSTEELFSLLKAKQPLYKDLFDRLAATEAQGLQELYCAYTKSISVPLVVAAIIRFGIPLCDQAVSVLHDALPRHELIDVFPTVMPEGTDNGLKYVEQDGEEPFRYSHFVAKPLWEVLKKRRDEIEEQPVEEEKISV